MKNQGKHMPPVDTTARMRRSVSHESSRGSRATRQGEREWNARGTAPEPKLCAVARKSDHQIRNETDTPAPLIAQTVTGDPGLMRDRDPWRDAQRRDTDSVTPRSIGTRSRGARPAHLSSARGGERGRVGTPGPVIPRQHGQWLCNSTSPRFNLKLPDAYMAENLLNLQKTSFSQKGSGLLNKSCMATVKPSQHLEIQATISS
ncbi:hypothetical protein ACROYT_G017837 [Oculina patagonica]